MFKKSDTISVLDSNVSIICENFLAENLDLLGKITGNIKAGNIFIKDKGSINGSVFCKETLKIENASLEGEVLASYIYLFKGSHLKGKVRYVNLHIEEGASLESSDIKKISEEEFKSFLNKEKNKEEGEV